MRERCVQLTTSAPIRTLRTLSALAHVNWMWRPSHFRVLLPHPTSRRQESSLHGLHLVCRALAARIIFALSASICLLGRNKMSKKTLVLVVFGLLAVGTYFFWSRSHSAAPAVAAGIESAQSNANNSELPGGRIAAKRSTGTPASTRASTPRARFEQSRDLFGLVQDLRSAADSGDVEARTIIADSLYECVSIAQPPDNRYVGAQQAEKERPELKGYVEGLMATDKQRCGRFVKADIGGANAKSIVAMYAKAATDGGAKALAMTLQYSNIDSMPDAALASQIQRIEASRDPDAIGALSNLMGGRAEDRPAAFGSMSGHEIQQYAWLLAACQMGMNCGPDSSLLRQYCLNAGNCGYGSIDQIVSSNYLTPTDYRSAVEQSHQIIKSLYGTHY